MPDPVLAGPMRLLGLNVTRTSDGMELDDGAAVLLEDGTPTVAIAQERLTRRKHDGGVGAAAIYCLQSRGLTIADVDHVVVSSCCDVPPQPEAILHWLRESGLDGVQPGQLLVNGSHHLSHAASAFHASPFDESVIVVADNEGNILGERDDPRYWLNRLERTSVYVGRGTEIRLLRRYGDGPGQLSLGAAYNHFAKWLGFRSYHDAGKVMALAAYGTGRFRDAKVFTTGPRSLDCLLPSQEPEAGTAGPAGVVESGPPDEFDLEAAQFLHGESVRRLVLSGTGADIGVARSSCAEPDATQYEVAWLIQSELERALLQIVREAVKQTGITRVCLAGGVALNCVANTGIARLPEVTELFVQPAASDVGQALGNVLWAYHERLGRPRDWVMSTCSLGRTYSRTELTTTFDDYAGRIAAVEVTDPAVAGADLIASGNIIGWFDAGSEFGLRGLGRRSVLGDPRDFGTKVRLDTVVKLREAFRPYAPSVLAEEASDWFDIDADFERTARQPMRFMFVAPQVRLDKRAQVPAITFVDGSARLQLVEYDENPRYHRMLQRFFAVTGVPMVLNTSFNAGGDPVVETPGDAVASMLKMNLDALIIGDFVVRRAD